MSDTASLLARLRALRLGEGQLALCHLGQASFLLRDAERTVLLDPYLSAAPGRRFAPPLDPEALDDVALVLVTHEHDDHFDPDTLRALAGASPEAAFVVPAVLREPTLALGVGEQRVHVARPGSPLTVAGVAVLPFRAVHARTPAEPYAFGYPGGEDAFLGYGAVVGGVRVYHAGDTLWWEGLEAEVAAWEPQLALLPVNGRDSIRERQGLVGNLDPVEAAHLAAAIGAQVLVPMHYDLFAQNLGDPWRSVESVVRGELGVAVLVLPLATPYVVAPA